MATLLHSGRITYYVSSGTSSPGTGGQDLRGKIVTYLESQDPATNSSYIRIDHYSDHYARTTGDKYVQKQDLKVRCNIGSYGGTYQSRSLGEKTYSRTAGTTTSISLGSTYHTVYHNSDGTGTLYVNAVYEAKPFGFTYNTQGCSLSVALPNIPRYATITGFTTSNVTPSSFQFNVTADVGIDYVQHSLNGGAWTDSGNQVIGGLNPLTQYSIKCRVRRTDSQLWTESGTIYVTTTQYAPSITGFSLSGQTLQTFVVNWSANTTIDTVNYSLDGGAWTTGQSGISATSGNFTLSGFNPNTYHTVKIQVRRPDGQVWSSDSSTLGITTLDIARFTNVPNNITMGDNITITYSNPSGATVQVGIYKTDQQTVIAGYRTITGGSGTFVLEPAEKNAMYSTITGSPYSTTLNFNLITIYNGTTYYENAAGRTFILTDADPVFTTWTYKDTGGTTTTGGARTTVTLTGSDQKFIKGYSNAEATVSVANKMVAQKQATAKDYTFSISGNNSTTVAYSGTNPVTLTIPAVQNAIFTLTANDSRGKSKAVAYTTANFVNYTPLARGIVANNIITRTGNVSKETTLKLDGTWYSGSFGSVTNSFKTAKYRFKETDSSTWSAYTNITLTTGTNVFSYDHTIAGDLGAEGFSIAESFNIQVLLQDELSTLTIDLILASGTPNLAIHKDGIAVKGIYDTNLGGALQVNGTVYINSKSLLDMFYPIGTIYETTSSNLDTTAKMANHFGGTWEVYGDGRVLVAKSADTEFDTIGETGGAKTHTLTEAQMPSHNHDTSFKFSGGTGGSGSEYAINWTNDYWQGPFDNALGAVAIKNRGGSQAHNNLQPYIVVYRYRRVS